MAWMVPTTIPSIGTTEVIHGGALPEVGWLIWVVDVLNLGWLGSLRPQRYLSLEV